MSFTEKMLKNFNKPQGTNKQKMIQFKIGESIPQNSKISTEIVEGELVIKVEPPDVVVPTLTEAVYNILEEEERDEIKKGVTALLRLLIIRAAMLKRLGIEDLHNYDYRIAYSDVIGIFVMKSPVEKMPAGLGFPSEELAEAFIKDLDVQALIGSAGHLIY